MYTVQGAAKTLPPYKGDAEACPSSYTHSASFGYDFSQLTSVTLSTYCMNVRPMIPSHAVQKQLGRSFFNRYVLIASLWFHRCRVGYRKQFGFLSSFCSSFALMSYVTGITGAFIVTLYHAHG